MPNKYICLAPAYSHQLHHHCAKALNLSLEIMSEQDPFFSVSASVYTCSLQILSCCRFIILGIHLHLYILANNYLTVVKAVILFTPPQMNTLVGVF